jgi:hypothetical protein
MRPHRTSLALATVVAALAGASAIDSASAQNPITREDFLDDVRDLDLDSANNRQRAQQSLPGTTSRPSSRDTRIAPMGRGMRDGFGVGRMNGGMGQR